MPEDASTTRRPAEITRPPAAARRGPTRGTAPPPRGPGGAGGEDGRRRWPPLSPAVDADLASRHLRRRRAAQLLHDLDDVGDTEHVGVAEQPAVRVERQPAGVVRQPALLSER